MLAQMEDSKPVVVKTGSNGSESVKADVLERFGATLFEMQDHFQDALFSKDVAEDKNGDTIRLAQKNFMVEHATVRRLRAKLREKEKLVMSLQKAIGAACETALDQKDKEGKEIACLHNVLSLRDERSLQDVKAALKDMIKERPEAAKGLAADLAGLLDDKLSDLLAKHDRKVEELHESLDSWKKRCRDLEGQIAESKQARLKDTSPQELQLVPHSPSPRRSEAFVEKLKLRLSVKECKVRQLIDQNKELQLQLARALESSIDANLQRSIAQNYERARRKAQYLEDLVTKLKKEVRHLKSTPSNGGVEAGLESVKVRKLEQELESERKRVQVMVFELAQQRNKKLEAKSRNPVSESSQAEAKAVKLKEVVHELTAKICKLQHTYQQLSSKFRGVRASSGAADVFDDLCLTQSARDMDTKEVHAKLLGRIKEIQKKLTQCQEDLNVSETNKQFFEEKLQIMEERALRAELKLATSGKKKAVELQKTTDEDANPNAGVKTHRLQKATASPGCVSFEEKEPEFYELRLLSDTRGVPECSLGGHEEWLKQIQAFRQHNDEATGDRKVVFANEALILELGFTHEGAQCKLLSKRKLRVTPHGNMVSSDRCQRESNFGLDPDTAIACLKNDVEQLRNENNSLRETRPSNLKYMSLMKKNKEVNKALMDLQGEVAKASKLDSFLELTTMEEILIGLRGGLKRWSGNSPWIQALAKLNTCCANLKKKLAGTFVLRPAKENTLHAQNVKESMRNSKADVQSSKNNVKNDPELALRLEEQASQLQQLQQELSQKIQAISNLNMQLDRRDSELDLLHEKSSDTTVQHCCQHLRENIENLQAENVRLKNSAANGRVLREVDDLKIELSEVYQVCGRYEQMLIQYTGQLGVPFKPSRF